MMRGRQVHAGRVVLDFQEFADDEKGAYEALRAARAALRFGDRRDHRVSFRTRRGAKGGWEVEVSYHGHSKIDVGSEIRKRHPKADLADVRKQRG